MGESAPPSLHGRFRQACQPRAAPPQAVVMRILAFTLTLVLAGCAATPRPAPTPARVAVPAAPREFGALIGLDANALAARLGLPRLQVREGNGTKLQFAGGSCLLDAYLYPTPTGGTPRVTHVDTRDREGRNVAQANCITMIETR